MLHTAEAAFSGRRQAGELLAPIGQVFIPTNQAPLDQAVDETGYAQPDWATLQSVRGRRTRYHQNPITGWKVGADGQVLFAIERVS